MLRLFKSLDLWYAARTWYRFGHPCNIAYFPKPGGKGPLNLQFFLLYAFVTRPLLNIPYDQRGPLTF